MMTDILYPSKENDLNIKRLRQRLGKLDEALRYFHQNSLYDYGKIKHEVGEGYLMSFCQFMRKLYQATINA